MLVPELGMLLLVAGGLGEEGGNLLIAVLLRLRGIVLIFYTGLSLARKSSGKVLKGLAI